METLVTRGDSHSAVSVTTSVARDMDTLWEKLKPGGCHIACDSVTTKDVFGNVVEMPLYEKEFQDLAPEVFIKANAALDERRNETPLALLPTTYHESPPFIEP